MSSHPTITIPAQISALASPIRHELIDTLFALGGEASVAEVAENCGRHADGLYYHISILEKVGLLSAVGKATGRNRRYRLCGDSKLPLRMAEPNVDAVDPSLTIAYVDGLLGITKDDFEAALYMGLPNDQQHRLLWAARNKGWVSEKDVAEISALLERLCALVSQARSSERQRLMSLAFVLAPQDAKQKRRPLKANVEI